MIREKMQSQRAKDTQPEIALRRELHRRGVRFRTGVKLPGLPRQTADIAWIGRKIAVFVDGCYWHGCPEHFHTPKTNTDWWLTKIARNQERDAATRAALEAAGWTVLRVWEHESPTQAADKVQAAFIARTARATAAAPIPSRKTSGAATPGL